MKSIEITCNSSPTFLWCNFLSRFPGRRGQGGGGGGVGARGEGVLDRISGRKVRPGRPNPDLFKTRISDFPHRVPVFVTSSQTLVEA